MSNDPLTIPAYKITLTGSALVGKSSLLDRYSEGKHVLPADSLAFVESPARVIRLMGEHSIHLALWDAPSQGRHRSAVAGAQYFENAHAVALVYDVTSPPTFFDLMFWRDEILRTFPRLPMLVIGNKIDLRAVVPPDEARGWAESLGMPFAQTSAATGEGVEAAFEALIQLAVREQKQRDDGELYARHRP